MSMERQLSRGLDRRKEQQMTAVPAKRKAFANSFKQIRDT